MYLLITYPGGVIAEGVVLAKGKNRLRAAVAGVPDTIELKRSESGWMAANGVMVECEFLMSDQYQIENTSRVAGAVMVA